MIDLGSGNIINGLDSFNIYVAKFNSKGACAWVSRFGGDHSQTVSGLACDATGNTYATGSFSNTTRFRTIKISASSTKTYPSSNFYLVKLNPSGDPVWIKRSKSTGRDDGSKITCDASGNVYVAGTFDKEFECDGQLVQSKGRSDLFVMKLNPQGKVLWLKNYGDATENGCNALYYEGEKVYASTSLETGHGYKALLVCLSASSGEPLWNKEVGSNRSSIESITVTKDNSVLITGNMESRHTFDARELFVTKLSSDGNDIWTKRFTGGFPCGRSITTDKNDFIYVTGEFSDSLRMGRLTAIAYPKDDIFFAKLNSAGVVQTLLSGGNSKIDRGYCVQLINDKIVFGGTFTNGLNFGKNTVKGSDNTVFVATFDRTKNTVDGMQVLVNEVVGRDPVQTTDIYGKLLYGAGPNKSFLVDQPLHLEDQNGSVVKRTVTDEKGDFSFKNIEAGISMNLVVEENKNLQENEEIFLVSQTGLIVDKTTMKDGKFKFPIIEAVITQLKEIEEDDVSAKFEAFIGDGGKEFMVTERISYDEGSWSIPAESIPYLNKIVQYMKKNSRIRVEINAHTDAIGDNDFNKKLSVMRGEEVKEYLVQKKISAMRISVIGHGEEKIINRCVDGVKCSESEHGYNRRTEFRFYLGSGL